MRFSTFYFLSLTESASIEDSQETTFSGRAKWIGVNFCQNRPENLSFDKSCPESGKNEYPANYTCSTSTCATDASLIVELSCTCSEKDGRTICEWKTNRSCPSEQRQQVFVEDENHSKIFENFKEYKFLETLPDGQVIANLFSFEPVMTNELNSNSANDEGKSAPSRSKQEREEIASLKNELLKVEEEILQAKIALGRKI
ncbi:unnamed protein product [Oikopleura dioica]|uniref:Uncharacterized protein n=1 Tax=Oikopleura dioica TaxID=34765 RepID=E4XJN0_OIKDI|nr:unnamed protein product [Oikopleura dioica]